MGKALIISDADFSSISVSMSDVVVDKTYTNAQLFDGAVDGFSSSTTGNIIANVSYKHKIVEVEGYTKVVINGWYPVHIGAFYNSKTNIGTSTFVNEARLKKSGDGTITNYEVSIPDGVVAFSLNLNLSYTNQSLNVIV